MKRIDFAVFGRPDFGKRAYAIFLLCAAAATTLPAQSLTTLLSFDGTDGANAEAGLVQGTDGNFYGTTENGGAYYFGTIFKITPSGAVTTLYSFCAQRYPCPDGLAPVAGMIQATDGDFYGTTSNGGANGLFGTVFKITPSGTRTTIHSFCSRGDCRDGESPLAGVIQVASGDLYGTTNGGGANCCGTVFKINPNGALTTLYSFCSQGGVNCTDGAYPIAALVQSSEGDFYGATEWGGTNNNGTIFKITRSGRLTTLYRFCAQSGCPDGYGPQGALVQGTDGDFYGTTGYGGAGGLGTVFKITQGGTLTTLHSFAGEDGAQPSAGVIQATDGNFYGTTFAGGRYNLGTIFRIAPGSGLTTLQSFDGTHGAGPFAALVQATNGDFYGTTYSGGLDDDNGTVFRLSVGLGPFVETQTSTSYR